MQADRGWSDAERRAIWDETDSGMTDDDALCDTSFNGIGYAPQVEMPDEVPRAAPQDADELSGGSAGEGSQQEESGGVDPATRNETSMDDRDPAEWQRKGATLSDKTARKEFGLTQEEIVQAIRAGQLQYRHAAMHGNPFLRLLRREVEALVRKRHGRDYLKEQQAKAELARITREIKRLKAQVAELEDRKTKLIAELEE